MLSLRAFVSERLTAAAEEIFDAVEKTIAEYKEEIFRLKDLEISRLKMEMNLLKSDLQHRRHQSPTGSVSEPNSHEDPGDNNNNNSSSSMDQDRAEPSQVKNEQDKTSWIHDDDYQDIDDLEPGFVYRPAAPNLAHAHAHLRLQDLDRQPSLFEEGRDGKPYCCSVCEKRFSNCSHLAAHIRTHTGERPYTCDTCSKTFVTTSALNRHKTIHTEGKRFVCTNCGKSFKWMESLGRHMRSVHKNDNIPA